MPVYFLERGNDQNSLDDGILLSTTNIPINDPRGNDPRVVDAGGQNLSFIGVESFPEDTSHRVEYISIYFPGITTDSIDEIFSQVPHLFPNAHTLEFAGLSISEEQLRTILRSQYFPQQITGLNLNAAGLSPSEAGSNIDYGEVVAEFLRRSNNNTKHLYLGTQLNQDDTLYGMGDVFLDEICKVLPTTKIEVLDLSGYVIDPDSVEMTPKKRMLLKALEETPSIETVHLSVEAFSDNLDNIGYIELLLMAVKRAVTARGKLILEDLISETVRLDALQFNQQEVDVVDPQKDDLDIEYLSFPRLTIIFGNNEPNDSIVIDDFVEQFFENEATKSILYLRIVDLVSMKHKRIDPDISSAVFGISLKESEIFRDMNFDGVLSEIIKSNNPLVEQLNLSIDGNLTAEQRETQVAYCFFKIIDHFAKTYVQQVLESKQLLPQQSLPPELSSEEESSEEESLAAGPSSALGKRGREPEEESPAGPSSASVKRGREPEELSEPQSPSRSPSRIEGQPLQDQEEENQNQPGQ